MDVLRLQTSHSAPRAAELAGLTYRQLDYFARQHIVGPTARAARGSGTRRAYSDADIARLRLAAALRSLGAPTATIREVLRQLHPDPGEWPPFLFVAPDGRVGENRPNGPACWMVGTRRLLAVESSVAA